MLKRDEKNKLQIDMQALYKRARLTFHLLMCELNQQHTFNAIIELYDNEKEFHDSELQQVVIKLLIRCVIGYEQKSFLIKILQMTSRHNKITDILNFKAPSSAISIISHKSNGSRASSQSKQSLRRQQGLSVKQQKFKIANVEEKKTAIWKYI